MPLDFTDLIEPLPSIPTLDTMKVWNQLIKLSYNTKEKWVVLFIDRVHKFTANLREPIIAYANINDVQLLDLSRIAGSAFMSMTNMPFEIAREQIAFGLKRVDLTKP